MINEVEMYLFQLDLLRGDEEHLKKMIVQYKARIYDLQQKELKARPEIQNAILVKTYQEQIEYIENNWLKPDEEKLETVQKRIETLCKTLIEIDKDRASKGGNA